MRRLALVMAVLVGCGGDDGGGPLTVDSLPDALINALCSAYVRCGVVSDLSSCRALLSEDLDINPELTNAVKNGSVVFDEDEARACIEGIGASCEQDHLFDENEHCALTFTGTVAAGGACVIDEQCLSQECDVPSCPDACCTGMCVGDVRPPVPRVGESCALVFTCLGGYCDTATQLCTAYKTSGQTCDDDDECGIGLFCAGTCKPYPAENEPCPDGECGSVGLFCHPSTVVCTRYALEGDSCDQTVICSPAYRCLGGSCVLPPRLGETCDLEMGCIGGSFCDAQTLHCTAPLPDGSMCTTSRQCQGDCDYDTMMCTTDPVCI